MSVMGVILRRATDTTFARPQAQALVDGYDHAEDPVEFTIKAHIQAMSDKELRNMPEGQNSLAWFNVWSQGEFKLRDRVLYRGKWHEIQFVSNWSEGESNFYRGRFVFTEDAL